MLAPVLAEAKIGTIQTFDVKVAARKKAGDVSVDQLGKSAKLPWEADGQRWHTRECLSHDGQRCRWEGEALQFVVDLLADDDRLSPVNWNHRSTIEVKARGGMGWLLHARSGHEWLLSLCFRVKKKTFDQKELSAALNLTPIDDVEEIQYYSQSPRVKVRNMKTPWQEVTIKIWKKAEVETPEFRKFLAEAVEGHLAQAIKEKANPDDLTPWKQLGRKWHLMKKGLPKKPTWEFKALEKLLPLVENSFEGSDIDYGIRSKINWKSADTGLPVAELRTKRKDSVDLLIFVPHDSVTVGTVADFGFEQDVKTQQNDRDVVQLRFDSAEQVSKEFKAWIAGL